METLWLLLGWLDFGTWFGVSSATTDSPGGVQTDDQIIFPPKP